MNQENKDFQTFNQDVGDQVNKEILKVFLTAEDWETNTGLSGQSPEDLRNRVENWVQYTPQTKSQLDRKGIIRFQVIESGKQIQLVFLQSLYQFSIFQAIFGNHSATLLKKFSRGRSTTLLGTIDWMLHYWPQAFKAYGFSGVQTKCLEILDYRRVFQLALLLGTVGAGFTRFASIQSSTSSSWLRPKEWTLASKDSSEQRLLLKQAFGKRADQMTDLPLIQHLDHFDFTQIKPRAKTFTEIKGYPFVGIQPQTLDASKYPASPLYESYLPSESLEGIKFAATATNKQRLHNLVQTGLIPPNTEAFQLEPVKKSKNQGIPRTSALKKFYPGAVLAGPVKLEARGLEFSDLQSLFDADFQKDQLLELRQEQTKKTIDSTLGKYLSSQVEMEKGPLLKTEQEVWALLNQFRSFDEPGEGKNRVQKFGQDPLEEKFADLEVLSALLPSLFVWYAAYNLYRFRLHFIYDVRKKPAPVLYTRHDHFGRLGRKVAMHEVIGLDGSAETIEKLFAALQRARGLGIYIPTVLHTIWETSLGRFIPLGAVKLFSSASHVLAVPQARAATTFANREGLLAEKLLVFHDEKIGFDPRFQFVKNFIKTQLKDLGQAQKVEAGLKGLLKWKVKALYLLERELSNAPIVAALNPGRYSLNTLPKGMLLVGEPGNGRSFLARALASETRVPFFKTESNRFIDPKFGVIRLMSLFRRVRNEAPGLLYIRDIDLITVDRERTTSPEFIQLTTQFLICFDGYSLGSESRPTQRKIFTLGSVSNLSRMDPACLRSGRFEWIINLRKPILGEREFLLKTKTSQSQLPLESPVAWNYFGLMTEGFTNAEVVSLVNTSTLKAIQTQTFVHTQESFSQAFQAISLLGNVAPDLGPIKKVGPKTGETFFERLHQNQLLSRSPGEHFQTKSIHLLKSIKNWQPFGNVSVLEMQNLGLKPPAKALPYSQKLLTELVDFLAEEAFLKQLRSRSPRPSFATQTSYCDKLTQTLNQTFLEGCDLYQLESGKKSLKNLVNWENLGKTGFVDLTKRSNLLSGWYKARVFSQLKLGTEEGLKTKLEKRLRELPLQYRTEYAVFGTVRGTYGTRGFQTRLQRPTTGPVSQVSRDFLELSL